MATSKATYDLPTDIVEQLLCSHCNGYVSCGPVKVQSDGGTICGRCSPSFTEECTRHLLFETAMSKFTFPCRYKQQGCQKRLLFGAIEHEDNCPYRTFACPSYGNCSKNVSVFDVHKHFQQDHANLILENGNFKLDLKQSSQCNFLMVENNIIVTVQYSYDFAEKVFYLDLRYFAGNNQEGAGYKLQIISGLDSDRTLNFKEKFCRRYEWRMINTEDAATFIMSNYLPALDNPDFVYIKVTMVNTNKCSLMSTEVVVEDNSLVSVEEKTRNAWESLENIRCQICHTYAVPPVFAVRLNCQDLIACYDCKSSYTNVRVKKVETPIFPCRWRGCTFIGNQNNIRKHMEDCEFRAYICPVFREANLYSSVSAIKCQEGFYTSNNLMDHMKRHGRYCPDPEKVIVNLYSPQTSTTKIYFTIFKNTVVAFTCRISNPDDWNLNILKNNAFNMDIYFEHDHCTFKSKTFSPSQFDCRSSDFKGELPQCFKYCKRITAVLKIKNK